MYRFFHDVIMEDRLESSNAFIYLGHLETLYNSLGSNHLIHLVSGHNLEQINFNVKKRKPLLWYLCFISS